MRVLASRISYVGELGWELYVPFEQGARLWDPVWEAGQPFGWSPVGIGVYATTARLEKSYRAYGAELEQEYTLVESGRRGRRSRSGLHRPRRLHEAARGRPGRHPVHPHRG